MAGWLYIIKQATGAMPGWTTPAKTHSLNTMFQEAITHRVPGEEHPDEGLQLSLCSPAQLHSSSLAEGGNVLAGPGAPASFIHPGTVLHGFKAAVSIKGRAFSSLDWGAEALICSG